MQKFIFLMLTALFFTCTVSLTSCIEQIPLEDDATPYIVNFTFAKPTLTTYPKNQFVPIEIRFDRNPSGYIHNVKVEIRDDKGVLVQKMFESNVHTFKTYTYSAPDTFKLPNAGLFKIKASTTDENGKQENTKEISLTIQ